MPRSSFEPFCLDRNHPLQLVTPQASLWPMAWPVEGEKLQCWRKGSKLIDIHVDIDIIGVLLSSTRNAVSLARLQSALVWALISIRELVHFYSMLKFYPFKARLVCKLCYSVYLSYDNADNSESIINCWLHKALSIYLHRNKTYATNIGKQLNSFQNRSWLTNKQIAIASDC